jgi:hypothetical protein
MNLNGWGLGKDCAPAIAEVQAQIENRFGWRRVRAWFDRAK